MNAAPKNTLKGRAGKGPASAFMSFGTITAMVLIGAFAFAALIVLSGFEGDFTSKQNGRAHAFSKSGIGYAGLSQLLTAEGKEVVLDRSTNMMDDTIYGLRIVTLDRPVSKPVSDEIEMAYNPTLIVMPKWTTEPMVKHSGWRRIRRAPIGPTYDFFNFNKALPETAGTVKFERGLESVAYDLKSETEYIQVIDSASIKHLQTMEGDNLNPLITANGKTILAEIEGESIYVLSDPDFLNTQGLAEADRAKLATLMLDGIQSYEGMETDTFVFDLTVHGFGNSDNLIKFLLRPPFLAATLCLIAAGLLTGWQAFSRFGDPEEVTPNYALGKSTLADNAARFIKIAGRQNKMAQGYVDLIRRRAARDMNIHGHTEKDINEILSRRSETLGLPDDWMDVKNATENAADNTSLLMAARNLYKWKQEISHDR